MWGGVFFFSNSLYVNGSLLNKSDKHLIHHLENFPNIEISTDKEKREEKNSSVYFAVLHFEFNRDCVIDPTFRQKQRSCFQIYIVILFAKVYDVGTGSFVTNRVS